MPPRRSPALVVHELTPDRWDDVEGLFGAKGACAGCWCMYWRLGEGERFEDVKGEAARRRFRQLVTSGAAHGVLAYAGGEPVGWAAFERRVDLPRLDRAPSLRCDDAQRVWSLPCLFVRAGWRGRGVATALVGSAVTALRRRRAAVIEAYPVLPQGDKKVPAAFAWTGVPALFERAGFVNVDPRPRGKQRYRLTRKR